MADFNLEPPMEQVVTDAPAHLQIRVIELRNAVLKMHPAAYSLAWPKQRISSFGFGPKKMSEHYFYIGVQAMHINAGFYFGAHLADPHALLEETGKHPRHCKVRTVQEAGSHGFLDLLVRKGRTSRCKPAYVAMFVSALLA